MRRDLPERIRQLRRTNLNLLPVLHAVLATQSIGLTAKMLGTTQPAVSQALKQLRAIFEDDLIVMIGRRAELTPKARKLSALVAALMDETHALLHPERSFDPRSDKLHARIVTADFVSALIGPYLLRLCSEAAPNVRIDFVGVDVKRIADLALVDLAILPLPVAVRLGKRMGSLPLWEDRAVCISANAAGLPPSLPGKAIRELPQFRLNLAEHLPEQSHPLLQPLARFERADAWSTEHYLALALTVSQSDRVAFVPMLLARMIRRILPIRITEIADEETTQPIVAVWSPALSAKPGHEWLRSSVGRAAQSMISDLWAGEAARPPEERRGAPRRSRIATGK